MLLTESRILTKLRFSYKLKKTFLTKIIKMIDLKAELLEETVENDKADVWQLFDAVKRFIDVPANPEAKGFSIFDTQKKNEVPLFVTKYYASAHVFKKEINLTQVIRAVQKGKFRRSPDTTSDKIFLHDVELYQALRMSAKAMKTKYTEEVQLADGRKAIAIFPVRQTKSGKSNEDLEIEAVLSWLDQAPIIEAIKYKFNLVEKLG